MKTLIVLIIFYCTTIFILKGAGADSATYKTNKWYQTNIFRTSFTPGILIAYGVSVKGDNGWPVSSLTARNYLQSHFKNFHTHIDNYLPYTPAIGVYALNLSGIKGKNKLLDRTLLYGGSLGIAEVVVYTLKTTTHELRPDNSAYNSFPSGHTMAAFVAAEFLHQEYRDESVWYSIAGYTLASSTAALRMLNNKHWLSDVAVGAGIGILCTRIVYLAYPWCKVNIVNPILGKRKTEQ